MPSTVAEKNCSGITFGQWMHLAHWPNHRPAAEAHDAWRRCESPGRYAEEARPVAPVAPPKGQQKELAGLEDKELRRLYKRALDGLTNKHLDVRQSAEARAAFYLWEIERRGERRENPAGSDWRKLFRDLETSGWRIEQTQKNHHKLYSPRGACIVVVAGTPSDHRAFQNTLSEIRRCQKKEADIMPMSLEIYDPSGTKLLDTFEAIPSPMESEDDVVLRAARDTKHGTIIRVKRGSESKEVRVSRQGGKIGFGPARAANPVERKQNGMSRLRARYAALARDLSERGMAAAEIKRRFIASGGPAQDGLTDEEIELAVTEGVQWAKDRAEWRKKNPAAQIPAYQLSPGAKAIFDQTVAKMQAAEDMGGPGRDYIQLMTEIAALARGAADQYRKNLEGEIGAVALPAGTALSGAAKDVFESVADAMLEAESMGGPEGLEYLGLMEAIASHALAGADMYRDRLRAEGRQRNPAHRSTNPAGMHTVLFVPVHGSIEIRSIDGTLESMQRLVGGMVEEVPLHGRVSLYVNEEGRGRGLPVNDRLTRAVGAALSQTIVGDGFFAATNRGRAIDLSKRDIEDLDLLLKSHPPKMPTGAFPAHVSMASMAEPYVLGTGDLTEEIIERNIYETERATEIFGKPKKRQRADAWILQRSPEVFLQHLPSSTNAQIESWWLFWVKDDGIHALAEADTLEAILVIAQDRHDVRLPAIVPSSKSKGRRKQNPSSWENLSTTEEEREKRIAHVREEQQRERRLAHIRSQAKQLTPPPSGTAAFQREMAKMREENPAAPVMTLFPVFHSTEGDKAFPPITVRRGAGEGTVSDALRGVGLYVNLGGPRSSALRWGMGQTPGAEASIVANRRTIVELLATPPVAGPITAGQLIRRRHAGSPRQLNPAHAGDDKKDFTLNNVDGDVYDISMTEFVADNQDMDPETIEAIRNLKPGEAYHGGGGAAPEWWIKRKESQVWGPSAPKVTPKPKAAAKPRTPKPPSPATQRSRLTPGDKSLLDFTVGNLHVGTPEAEVAELIRKKLGPSIRDTPLGHAAVEYALDKHYENLRLYSEVVNRRTMPKVRPSKALAPKALPASPGAKKYTVRQDREGTWLWVPLKDAFGDTTGEWHPLGKVAARNLEAEVRKFTGDTGSILIEVKKTPLGERVHRHLRHSEAAEGFVEQWGTLVDGKERLMKEDGLGEKVAHVRVLFDGDPHPVWVPSAKLFKTPRTPNPARPTFEKAREAIFAEATRRGMTVRRESDRAPFKPLKVPEIRDPASGKTLYFHAQAVYDGPHSTHLDIRDMSAAEFLDRVLGRSPNPARRIQGWVYLVTNKGPRTMFLITNAKGEIELEVPGDNLDDVERAAEKAFPKHTPVFANFDITQAEREHLVRDENPVENSGPRAMVASGLPWNPSAPRPGGGKGVGITMGEVIAAFPMTKEGLAKAHEALLPYFPHTPGTHGTYEGAKGGAKGKRRAIAEEFGYDAWRTPHKMASHLLRTNTKTKKAIDGVDGTVVKPSLSVGINILPYDLGRIMSGSTTFEKEYYANPKNKIRRIHFTPMSLEAAKLRPGDAPEGKALRMLAPTVGFCVGSSADCRSTCLVYTGQNGAVAYNDYSKLQTTRALFFQPLAFARMLMEAIHLHVVDSRKHKVLPYVRLNVYSDIPWELFFPELFDWAREQYKDLWFYDYTKVPGRGARPKPNYDLTFSYSGKNLHLALEQLKEGMRVAVVFMRKTARGSKKTGTYKPAEDVTDIRFHGYRVIDGDPYDMRPMDPGGVIVGLRFKVPRKIEVKDTGNFVLKPPPANAKMVVRAEYSDGQWVYQADPTQTNVDVATAMNEIAPMAAE